MSVLYIFLTLLMFLDCLILVLLVLLQLPKKEAGAGVAFGAGATDALFGAGSGNVLTTITKYAAGIFFGLAIIMAVVASHSRPTTGGESLQQALSQHNTPASPLAASPSGSPALNNGLQSPLFSNAPASVTVPSAPAKTPAPASTNH